MDASSRRLLPLYEAQCGCQTQPIDLQLLETTMAELGQPAFRAAQVWEWGARGAVAQAGANSSHRSKPRL